MDILYARLDMLNEHKDVGLLTRSEYVHKVIDEVLMYIEHNREHV